LVQSLYVFSLFKFVWCALHDYRTIYVIPMMVIVLWDDICYSSIVVLRLYGLSYFGITPMIHAMNYLCIMSCLSCNEVLDTTKCW
jgi:hypothetical protein